MRPLFLTLLSLAACARVNSGQPIEHPVVHGAALGTGFSSLTGHAAGKCVVPRPVETVRDRVDKLEELIVYVHNKQEMLRAIGYSGGVNFGIFGVGINAGVESIDRKFHSHSTSFVLVQVRINTASRALGKYQLEKHAAETLRREGPGKFYETCGDGFVAEQLQGGYFLGIIELENVSREEARKLSGNAGVSFLGMGVHGGASSESKRFFSQHNARYFVIQEGGAADGAVSLQPEQSIETLLGRAKRFQETVTTGKAVPTRLVVMPYQNTSNRPRPRGSVGPDGAAPLSRRSGDPLWRSSAGPGRVGREAEHHHLCARARQIEAREAPRRICAISRCRQAARRGLRAGSEPRVLGRPAIRGRRRGPSQGDETVCTR